MYAIKQNRENNKSKTVTRIIIIINTSTNKALIYRYTGCTWIIIKTFLMNNRRIFQIINSHIIGRTTVQKVLIHRV